MKFFTIGVVRIGDSGISKRKLYQAKEKSGVVRIVFYFDLFHKYYISLGYRRGESINPQISYLTDLIEKGRIDFLRIRVRIGAFITSELI